MKFSISNIIFTGITISVNTFTKPKVLNDYTIGKIIKIKEYAKDIRVTIKVKPEFVSCKYKGTDLSLQLNTDIDLLPPDQTSTKVYDKFATGHIVEVKGHTITIKLLDGFSDPGPDWLPYYVEMLTLVNL